jgi:hypothetical protein
VALADFLNDGSVAAGDWTIAAKKNQHGDFVRIGREWIERTAVEIEGLLRMRKRGAGKDQQDQ